ncbi:DUF4136 domain-containing protein [bacterium]|nr:DUF4136 domain-containing protein [bacterium]
MTILLRTVVFVILSQAISCASVKVRSDYNKQVDFQKYQTYNWILQPKKPFAYLTGSILDRKRLVEQIKRSVERELRSNGYRINKGKPDFLVAFHTNVKEKLDIAPLGYSYDNDSYFHRRMQVGHYQEGSLVLDFIDSESNELFWRGWAVGAIRDPDKIEDQIDKAIRKILENFPPRKTS